MSKDSAQRRPGYFPIVLVIGGISISFASILIKFCPDVPALIISSYRTGLVALALFPFFILRKKNFPVKFVWLSLFSGTFLALHFAFWIASLKFTTVASSLFVLSIYPFLASFLSWLLLGERIPPNFFLGAFFTILGIGVIFSADLYSVSFTRGNLLSFLGAIALAAYFVSGRLIRRRVGILDYLFMAYGWASVLLTVVSIAYGLRFTGYSAKTYVYLFLLAAVPQGLGHSAFNWALRYVKTGLVSLTTLVESIGASLLAWLILGEEISPLKLVGIVLVAAGISLGWLKE